MSLQDNTKKKKKRKEKKRKKKAEPTKQFRRNETEKEKKKGNLNSLVNILGQDFKVDDAAIASSSRPLCPASKL